MLVEKGAKLSAKNKDGFSVLDAASKKGKFKITATSVVNKLVYIIKSINIFEISSKVMLKNGSEISNFISMRKTKDFSFNFSKVN